MTEKHTLWAIYDVEDVDSYCDLTHYDILKIVLGTREFAEQLAKEMLKESDILKAMQESLEILNDLKYAQGVLEDNNINGYHNKYLLGVKYNLEDEIKKTQTRIDHFRNDLFQVCPLDQIHLADVVIQGDK